MRFITGIFVQIDPIGIIELYIDDLRNNLKKMGVQINSLRGQMRKLKNDIDANARMMEQNMQLASRAKDKGKDQIMVLKARKAGRLQKLQPTPNGLVQKNGSFVSSVGENVRKLRSVA